MKHNLIYFLINVILISCSIKTDSYEVLEEEFDKNEQKTINQIVDYLDSVVIKTVSINQLEVAYPKYLDFIQEQIYTSGEISFLGLTDYKDIIDFFKTLDQEHLSEYYIIKSDTIKIHCYDQNMDIEIYDPYIMDLNMNGKFLNLLSVLSKNNPGIQKYYEGILISGGISPGNYSILIKNYDYFDFDLKSHRLIYAISFFLVNRNYLNEC